MDKKKAIESLKKALDELPHLRTLTLNNRCFDLWCHKVSDILEETFGKTSTEYDRFNRAVTVSFPTYTNKEKQKEYNRHLDEYETALKSIIQKYELPYMKGNSATNDKISICLKIWDGCKDFVATIVAKFIAEKTK